MTTYLHDGKVKLVNEWVGDVNPWIWPSADECGWAIIKWEWENNHSKKWPHYIKNYRRAFQAGGCAGLVPRMLACVFKIVYTCEPDPLNFHCLVNNCAYDSIIKLNVAVGDKNEMVGWIRCPSNVGMHKINNEEQHHLLPMIKIDDLGLIELDLLALDLEGYEPQALRGAVNTIQRNRPTVIVEHGELAADFMKQLGYITSDKSHEDVIFTPKERIYE